MCVGCSESLNAYLFLEGLWYTSRRVLNYFGQILKEFAVCSGVDTKKDITKETCGTLCARKEHGY